MSAEILPFPPRPPLEVLEGGPTLSVAYAEDAWDWADASELELRTEHTYFSQRPTAYDAGTVREELARIERAAKMKGMTL